MLFQWWKLRKRSCGELLNNRKLFEVIASCGLTCMAGAARCLSPPCLLGFRLFTSACDQANSADSPIFTYAGCRFPKRSQQNHVNGMEWSQGQSAMMRTTLAGNVESGVAITSMTSAVMKVACPLLQGSPNGAGENWLDVRSPRLKSIMIKRLKYARSVGCNGVEPDNMSAYRVR